MGLVAAIFTYLCSVTILVVTLGMTFGALLYSPDQTTIAQQITATAVKPHAAQPAQVSSVGSDRLRALGAKEMAADVSNSTARSPRTRRVVRQVRANEWLRQQEPKIFGYVEEPSASFLYDRFQ